jgi:hypothetical protein
VPGDFIREAFEYEASELLRSEPFAGCRQKSKRLAVESYEHPLLANRARRNRRKRPRQLDADELHDEFR